MRRGVRRAGALPGLVVAALAGCGDDGSGPDPAGCEVDTSSVEASVSVEGGSVVFDWTPGCGAAVVHVEGEEESVQWLLITDGSTWDDPGAANLIRPPLTYGVPPSGIPVGHEAEALVPGTAYTLEVWRIIPIFTQNPSCIEQQGQVCLVAVEPFTR
ncbi:MAG TPA: hypothetical protein VGA70_01585 [Longimicrobiales bacterium]|jgi:hypothetical protein